MTRKRRISRSKIEHLPIMNLRKMQDLDRLLTHDKNILGEN